MEEHRRLSSLSFPGLLTGLGLSVLASAAYLLVPTLITSHYYQRSLSRARDTAGKIKQRFTRIEDVLQEKKRLISMTSIPDSVPGLYSLINKMHISKRKEGVAYYVQDSLKAWEGNVIDIRGIIPRGKRPFHPAERTFLIKNKASVYLVTGLPVEENGLFIFYHLLSFKPQFKTPYLKEHHFLPDKLLANCSIDYHDFRTEIQGYERIFQRNNDEYIGQPRYLGGAQTLFFPLRTPDKAIAATVALTSPPLSTRIIQIREFLKILIFSFWIISLALALFLLDKSPFFRHRKALQLSAWLMCLAAIRYLFLRLSLLGRISDLSIFSPAKAGFLSIGNLTKSPADIFLTSFIFFLAFAYVIHIVSKVLLSLQSARSNAKSLLFGLAALVFSLCSLYGFQVFLMQLVKHSSIDFFQFSPKAPSLLLHLSIFFFFSAFLTGAVALMKVSSWYSDKRPFLFLAFTAAFCIYALFSGWSLPILAFHALALSLAVLIGFFPAVIQRKRFIIASLAVFTVFIYVSLYMQATTKNHIFIENSLQSFIKSQENWSTFLLEQSLQEIDDEEKTLSAFFHNPEPIDLAHLLWEKTLLAKFNQYSRLEIMDARGIGLSSFALNVPEIYRPDFEFPESRTWSIIDQKFFYFGKEKDFLVAYRDWHEDSTYLGRLVLFAMVDFEALPFLYSANPYFEVMRSTSMPSLDQLDLGFAIYGLDGKLKFNPGKRSAGISPQLLQKLTAPEASIWTVSVDKGKRYQCFYFRWADKIFSLFIPIKSFLTLALEFSKLFIFYGCLFILLAVPAYLLFFRQKIRNPLWSFSNRVYLSFIAVILIPLVLFSISTRSFFAAMLTEQFTDKAEVHAGFAKRVMEEFEYLQKEEQVPQTLPPDNIVLWISSTIANDVNLYQGGKLISSSRREFFDYGLFPDLVDGEIFYKIKYQNMPFATQTQVIGKYAFHTLTIPYSFKDSQLLISLPFPQAKQELSKATEDLIDFLFLISIFFIIAVLPFARGIGGMIIRPIQKLLVGTREVGLGNLEVTLNHKNKDEMRTLIDGFNTMTASLKKHQQELTEMGKKVAWAEMARKVAHEIKNPLTPIQLSAEHLLTVYKDAPENFQEALNESVSYIITEVDNLRKIAHEFMKIAREVKTQKERFDLKSLIEETIAPYKKILSHRIIFSLTTNEDNFTINADREKIAVALKNIFTNAIEAIEHKGKVTVHMSRTNDHISLSISDTGKGIEAEALSKIFDSYFSTKVVGTGLGLSIAKKIIEDHEGRIAVVSRLTKGTRIEISLPANSPV